LFLVLPHSVNEDYIENYLEEYSYKVNHRKF